MYVNKCMYMHVRNCYMSTHIYYNCMCKDECQASYTYMQVFMSRGGES